MRLRPRERALGVEHRAEPRRVGHRLAQRAGTKIGAKSSMREEDRRRVALHADVEAQAVVLGLGDQRRAVALVERREHRIGAFASASSGK